MNLQIKLTLSYVLLVVVLVGLISGVDLINTMQQRFDATLTQAETIRFVAGLSVSRTLNSQRTKALSEALSDPELSDVLSGLLRANAILEVAVVDPKNSEILADSNPERVHDKAES